MRFIIVLRVTPTAVSGRGIPFGPRHMWRVQDWSHLAGDEPREQLTPSPAFWSRRMAEAYAAERAKATARYLQLELAALRTRALGVPGPIR